MSSSSSTMFFQHFPGHFYSRRLLLHTPLYSSPAMATPPMSPNSHLSFDADHVMVLVVLLCALICSLALGLHSIIRCALKRTNIVASESMNNPAPKLANVGIKKKVLSTFPTLIYSDGLNQPGLDNECVICLSEFTHGECVRVLPKCNHGFHVRCIDEWLNSHSSCPTCRHCLIETGTRANSSSPLSPPPPPDTIISIVPLEPE
ncbi:RING-H2 finger protein ATL78-like [Cornus florida]|uniref:RING-H2 finger protein ATL78-like n=1 Tax=Cornus florida TaxID=4283 RepID=UPI00289A0B84|nr:RING-H2 finger protein ATL78-like [Cornus florida]